MKSYANAPLYFSAYPLKAVEQQPASIPSQPTSPYLRSLLEGNKKSSSVLRVYPMLNPYTDHAEPVALRPHPAKAQSSENKEWFKDYE